MSSPATPCSYSESLKRHCTSTFADWEHLLTRLPHLECMGSVHSSHLPFKMHQVCYVHSSLPLLMYVGSIATPLLILLNALGKLKLSNKTITPLWIPGNKMIHFRSTLKEKVVTLRFMPKNFFSSKRFLNLLIF